MTDTISTAVVAWLEKNSHGHCYKRKDGDRARCGGPAICEDCRTERRLYRLLRLYIDAPHDNGILLATAVLRDLPDARPEITELAHRICDRSNDAAFRFGMLCRELGIDEAFDNDDEDEDDFEIYREG